MTIAPIKLSTRLASMILDHVFMTMITMIFVLPTMLSQFSSDFLSSPRDISILFLGLALYFCKDCINGRSIAKRIFKLQVVDNTTNLPASPLKCFLRNIFCIIWPIEVIMTLLNPNRRIGDLVANTKISVADLNYKDGPINWSQVIVSLILSYILMGTVYLLTSSI